LWLAILKPMVLVSLLIAPVLMYAAIRAEQRRGACAGGWVAALPVSISVGAVVVTSDSGARVAQELLWSTAAHVGAQVVFGVGYASALRRGGALRGLACGIACYGACSVLIAEVPDVLAAGIAIPALLLAPRLLPTHRSPPSSPRRPAPTALICIGASIVVALAVFGSRLAGPGVGGMLAAFPTMSSLLAVVIARRSGPTAGIHALAGLIRSLPCYLTFCLLAALTVPGLQAAAVPVALLASAAVAHFTWRALSAAAPAPSPA
jgi:hypothetical protein